MTKLPGIFLARPREIITIANVRKPSVSAPRWMSTFKRGPSPISGKVSIMSLTPIIDPITWRENIWSKTMTIRKTSCLHGIRNQLLLNDCKSFSWHTVLANLNYLLQTILSLKFPIAGHEQ